MDLDLLCQNSLAHHRKLIAEAARRRLRSDRVTGTGCRGVRPAWQATLASWLRRAADRLEGPVELPQLGVLRAVAHREIDVEQGLRLLAIGNGNGLPAQPLRRPQ